MNLEKIIAVSGLPGLYNIVSSRNNGLLVANMDDGKTKFCSVRKHQFTPLETVAIYTQMDTAPLKDVFESMLANAKSLAIPSTKESSGVISDYFVQILPDYDPDRVQISDIKKIIKWYNFLDVRGVFNASDEEE